MWVFNTASFPGSTTSHRIGIKTYLCPSRNRGPGWKPNGNDTNRASGAVTDYAINNRINHPATNTWQTNNGSGNVVDNRITIQTILDGSSNTILVGEKALRIPKHADTSASDWDEGIVQGGWGGTGRGGTNNGSNSQAAQTDPVNGFILVRDNINNSPPHNNKFGGPHTGTVLFLLGDGSVRGVSVTVAPAALCYALNPTDGQTVPLP